MTTIAYKDGVLAADTRVTAGTTIFPNESKIVEGVGIAGSWEAVCALRNGQAMPKKGWEALTVAGTMFDSGGEQTLPEGDFWAIGSGAHFALGAMAMGATPEEAVKIAARYDTGTNDTVETAWR